MNIKNTVNTSLIYNILDGTIFNVAVKELDILVDMITWCLSEPTIKVGDSYFDYDAMELAYWPAHYFNYISDKYNMYLGDVNATIRNIELRFNTVSTEQQKKLMKVTLFKKDLIIQQIIHVVIINYQALQYFI